ncbi:MAG: AAA-like domain-containing protein [Polyangiales bacterium]
MPDIQISRSEALSSAHHLTAVARGHQTNFVVQAGLGLGKTTFLHQFGQSFGATVGEAGSVVVRVGAEEIVTNERVDVAGAMRRLTYRLVESVGGTAASVDRLSWEQRVPQQVLRTVFEDEVLLRVDGRYLLMLDNLEALAETRAAAPILSLLREWGESVTEPPFDRLHIVVAINQSPSELGGAFASLGPWRSVELKPFTLAETALALARAVGAEVDARDAQLIHAQTGGHPSILAAAFSVSTPTSASLARWLASAEDSETVDRLLATRRAYLLARAPRREAVRRLLAGDAIDAEIARDLVRLGLALIEEKQSSLQLELRVRPIGEVIRRWLDRVCR